MTMIAESEHAQVWKYEEWNPAPALPKGRTRKGIEVCPYVGLRLPSYPTEYSLKAAWFSKQELKSWYIKPMRRRALYNLMRRNLHNWADWLRLDSTHTFNRELKDYQKFNDGATIGITGPKGSGKSWLAAMTLNRAVDTIPHVIFEYKDLEIDIPQRGEESVGIQVDENLKATGNDSKNLVVHVNNALDTGRKADLWVICTGINLNFQGWGDTLDIRMIPFGFNRRFQATRAAFFDVKNDFLGFCVLQREHTPKDYVYYYSELGTWGEYEARARAYSLTVTKKGGATDAIDSTTQDRHVARLKDFLQVNYVDKHLKVPSDLMCGRLYRKCELPAKSVRYMKEVIAWAKFELKDDPASIGKQGEDAQGFQTPYIEITEKGWSGLRTAFEGIFKDPAIALYYVPPHPKISDREVVEIEGLGIEPASLGTTRRRRLRDIATSTLGRLGEAACVPWLDSLLPRVGTGAKGQADILLDIEGREVALNVKLTLKDGFKESLEVTPEDRWMPHALAVLLIPRQLQIRLYKITGPVMTLNWHRGVLATPDTLAQTIKEMIDRV